MKKCNTCDEALPRNLDFFTQEKRSMDGLSGKCKDCRKKERSPLAQRNFIASKLQSNKTRIEMMLDNYEIVTESGCWIWMGATTKKGYGDIKYKADKKASHHRAHRLAYELHKGEIPKGMLVCHTCDIPGCINPSHLFVGTAQDNTDDMIKKGRQNFAGMKNGIPYGWDMAHIELA